MEEKICQVHESEILSVCFFDGCNQYLLCGECFGFHPDNHKSKIKSMMSLMRKDDWIKSYEEQRDSQIAHMKSFYQAKDSLIDDSQKNLKGMVEEIIECLTRRLSQWVEEVTKLLDFNKNEEIKITFAELEDSISSLGNINFRKGDIYEKVDNVKLFNEDKLPNSIDVCKQVQDAIDKVKIDQNKLDSYKKEIFELLESIHVKDFFALSKSTQQNASQQLNIPQQEYENLKQEENEQIEKLAQDIKHLANLKAQLNQLTVLNNDYKQKIESLTITNQELKDEVSVFEAELNSVVSTKLKLHEDFDTLNIAYKKLIEKFPKAKFLSEDSLLVQNKDLDNIRDWIPNLNLDKPGSFKLDLLYRATRDGFNSEAFHKKCVKKSPTIVFIKSKEHGLIFKEQGRVFGGYTTKNWEINGSIEDNKAFLFSLTHGEKYPIKQSKFAICRGPDCIFTFGESDIVLPQKCNTSSNQAWSYFPTSYQCSKFTGPAAIGAKEYLAGSHAFTVEEIEVYQVVWLE